jgi:tetratricopeptide (TPR) repeat protein
MLAPSGPDERVGMSIRRTYAFAIERVALAHAVAGRLDEADRAAVDAHGHFEALAKSDTNDRRADADRALASSTVGAIALQRRELPRARRLLEVAVAQCEALSREGADYADLNSDCAVAIRRQGDLYLAAGNEREARERYERAMAMLDTAPRDLEYGPERALVYLRASRVAATPEEVAARRTEAIAEWERVWTAGVRTWMFEFGGPTVGADAIADARRAESR